eukprot:239561_1
MDPTLPLKSEITFVIIAISFFILGPLLIYHMIRFKKLMELQMIQKRYPKILLVTGIFVVSWLMIGFPLMCIDFSDIATTPAQHELIDRLNYCVAPVWSVGMFFTVAWRFWHMFYDLMVASLQKDNWKNELDPDLESSAQSSNQQNQFYMKNKATYGSKQWTKNKIIAIYAVSTMIIIVFYQLFIATPSLFVAHFISFAVHFVVVVLALRLAFNIPSYCDHYFVRHEMKLTLYQLLIAPVFATLALVGYIFTASTIYMTALTTIATLLVFNVSIVSFWWVPKKIVTEEENLKAYQETAEAKKKQSVDEDGNEVQSPDAGRRGSQIILPEKDAVKDIVRRLSMSAQGRRASLQLPQGITGTDASGSMDVDDKVKSFDLPDIFYNDECFSEFMGHLAKDFSTEYLLCFVEIMQFKYLMKKRFDIVDAEALAGTDVEFDIEYPLYGVAPLSEINKNGFKQDLAEYKANDDPSGIMGESKAVVLKIYKKYLETGAEYKIELLEETKKTLDNLLKNEAFFMQLNASAEQVFCIYDETVGEVFSVLNAYPTFQRACKIITMKKMHARFHQHSEGIRNRFK